ncbi:MAG: iron-containing alcohol dehydrogenase [Suipraeoptans sp.]
MEGFKQYLPTEIVFGKDTQIEVSHLVKKYGGSRVFIAYGDGSVVKSGLLKEVEGYLEDANIAYKSVGGIKPNPLMSYAIELAAKAKEFNADIILAVGGGSVIDTAKAITYGVAYEPESIESFWDGDSEPKKRLPIGVILTISAAGSETSNSAVLTNEKTGIKKGLGIDLNRPDFAIMNPELTYTLPKYQVSCGIVDIYMHTIERYFTPPSENDMTDEIAEGLMRNVIKNGHAAYSNPTDYHAMSEIMWCGSLSHNGITGYGRTQDFSVHGLGHPLSSYYDIAHGATLSALWGSWARYVYKKDTKRFAHYGKHVFGIEGKDDSESALMAIAATEKFFASLDMPISIGQLSTGVLADDKLKELAENATHYGKRVLGSFIEIRAKEGYEIYKDANK